MVGGTIGLSGVNVELDGNSAEGVLTFATDGRQTLQGTLAADTLDLTPYISTVRLLTANQREWNSSRIALEGLSGMDFDLRLSAANVSLSNAKIGRTAIAANLRGGHLAVTVGEAQAYGGVIKGSLALANFEARRRRQIADAVHRRRSGKLPRPAVRPAPARRQGQHLAQRRRHAAKACWA